MSIGPPAFSAGVSSAGAGVLRNGTVVGILAVLLLEHFLLPEMSRQGVKHAKRAG